MFLPGIAVKSGHGALVRQSTSFSLAPGLTFSGADISCRDPDGNTVSLRAAPCTPRKVQESHDTSDQRCCR